MFFLFCFARFFFFRLANYAIDYSQQLNWYNSLKNFLRIAHKHFYKNMISKRKMREKKREEKRKITVDSWYI